MYKQTNEGQFLGLSQSSGWSTQTWPLVSSKTDHILILLWAIWTADLAAYNIVHEQNARVSVVVIYSYTKAKNKLICKLGRYDQEAYLSDNLRSDELMIYCNAMIMFIL